MHRHLVHLLYITKPIIEIEILNWSILLEYYMDTNVNQHDREQAEITDKKLKFVFAPHLTVAVVISAR